MTSWPTVGNALDLPEYPISPVAIHGDLVITAGVIPIDPATGNLVEGDAGIQAAQAIDNLAAILAAAGAGLADVLMVDVVLADAERDFADFNAVYEKWFSAPYPARRTIGARLAMPGLLVEIQAMSRRGTRS